MAIVVNKPLPEFEANATGGVKVTNTSHNGQTFILYFYPKDNTPGLHHRGHAVPRQIQGIRKGRRHCFRCVARQHDDRTTTSRKSWNCPFELIADTEEKMCHMFGVVKNKIMYGKKVKGIERSTFLVNADGILVQRVARPESPLATSMKS